jgi:hypothetical protein
MIYYTQKGYRVELEEDVARGCFSPVVTGVVAWRREVWDLFSFCASSFCSIVRRVWPTLLLRRISASLFRWRARQKNLMSVECSTSSGHTAQGHARIWRRIIIYTQERVVMKQKSYR